MAIGGTETPGSSAEPQTPAVVQLLPQGNGYALPQGTTVTLAYLSGDDLVLAQPHRQ